MFIYSFLLSVILSTTGVTITEPVAGGSYDGDWLTVRAIVENDNEFPDSVHYTLNGEPVIQIPRLNTDWYTYMANDCRTGYSESPAPHDNTILWSLPISGTEHEFVSPVIVDGRVYYASEEDEIAYCLDAATGEEIWRYENIGDAIDDAMHVVDGRAYIASDSVWCLDALTGSRIWAFRDGNPFGYSGPPVPWEEYVFVCSSPGPVYCLNIETGEEIWETSFDYTTVSSMTVCNELLLVPTHGSGIFALDVNDGSVIWENTDGGGCYWDSSPVVVEGTIYICGEQGPARAIDAETGVTEWTSPPTGWVNATPVFHDERLYFANIEYSPSYFCLDALTGLPVWISPDYTHHGSSGGADGLLFFGESPTAQDSCSVVALNMETGAEVWSYKTSCSTTGFQSSPSITDGVMYYACTDGYLYAFGTGQKYTYLDDLFTQIGSNELIVTSYAGGVSVAADTISFTVTGTGINLDSSHQLNLSASPNPFVSTASVSFNIPKAGYTSIEIFDLAGRCVTNLLSAELITGSHTIQWDGRDDSGVAVSAGLYLCRIQSGGVVETTGLCLLK
jgi:outer membrane protein assembly factor BamB